MNACLLSPIEKSAIATAKKQFSDEYVAGNKHTPVATLALLSKSSCLEVKLAVAENSSTSLFTLLELARDSNPDLRFTMAENPNLPIAALTILSEDDNPYVACQAERTLCLVRKGSGRAMNVVSICSNARGVAHRGFKLFIQTLTRIAKVC